MFNSKLYLKLFVIVTILFSFNYISKSEPTIPNSAAARLRSISGYVKDSRTGEALIGATIFVHEVKNGTMTNQYGFFSVSMLPGKYQVDFSYVGYKPVSKTVSLADNITINLELSEDARQLDEIVVKSDRPQDKIKRPEMSVAKLEMKTIKKVPAIFGETDVIKVIQMLPGVQPTAEGTSGFSVRGGGIDQNLIVLDEATVYNASHLMGFFSVFNNDAVRDVKLYKGDIPANYGGRLSSVLDVRMKEGNSKNFEATGGIGLLSSRLTLEGPIRFGSSQDSAAKTSYLISGRRTYADIFFPLFSNADLKKSILYFYDLNLKINHQLNANNRLYLSSYWGRDNFGQKGLSSAGFGNKTSTLRWNHQFSSILFLNLTAIVSNYNYSLEMNQGGAKYFWSSNLLDYGLKADFNLYPNPNNEIRFGVSSIRHYIDPCNAWIEKDTSRQYFPRQLNYSLEHAFYVSNQEKITDDITLKYGIRYSIFQNIGPADQNYFNSNHQLINTVYYPSNHIYNTYSGWEPRLGLNYSLTESSSIKASYSRTFQYLQLASNSNGGMSLDYWFPSTPNVKPQKSDQVALGYFRNVFDNKIETSIEGFYKKMYNVIDFRDHADLLFNSQLEADIRTGNAHSYGLEFLIRKNEGNLTGWISYTYSRALRKVADINNGNEYSAPYDKPHNINVVLNYEFNQKLSFSANWIYSSGTPITFPVGSYQIGNNVVSIYSGRNAYRMRDYHRLDLSLTYTPEKKSSIPYFSDIAWNGEWVFSVYNAYGRHNDWMINFVDDKLNSEKKIAQRMYLPFEFLPGITYNFKF